MPDQKLLADRNMLVRDILKAMLINNELRHDLTKGTPLNRGNHAETVGRIFDLADALVAEGERRLEIGPVVSSTAK